jgi:hypothetical protein
MKCISQKTFSYIASVSLIWTALSIAQARNASADQVTLDSFFGEYKGNVKNSPLGVGRVAKTGRLKVVDLIQSVELTTWSKLKEEITLTIRKDNLMPYFSNKKEAIRLDNGQIEERVAFTHSIDDNYGFLNRWLGGLSATQYDYQFRFVDGVLSAFRVQRHNTSKPEHLTYLLEVGNVEKVIPEVIHDNSNHHQEAENTAPQRRTDWDF